MNENINKEELQEIVSEEQQIDYTTEINQIMQLNILAVALLFVLVLKGGK